MTFWDDDAPRSRWAKIGLLTLLIHALLLSLRLPELAEIKPTPIDILPLDSAQLDSIRSRWKERTLLLSQDPTPPKEDTPAPKDARFETDRNIRVERETRARVTDVMPKPGAAAQPQTQPQAKAQIKPHSENTPALQNLGIAWNRPQPKTQPRQNATQAQPRVDQTIRANDVPEGSENILNAERSVYYSFYSRLYEGIAPLWSSRVRDVAVQLRLPSGDYTTLAEVILDAEGHLLDVKLTQSSGVQAFDQAVLYAWRRLARFPNPPKGLLDAQGRTHLGWSFTVQYGGETPFRLLPPTRTDPDFYP